MAVVSDLQKETINFRFGNYVVLAITCSFAPLSIDLIAPALPVLADYFSAPLKSIQLSVFVFLAGYSLGPFFWGVASDRWGRNPAMIAGLLLYIFSSIACGVVTDVDLFIAVRFLQGFAAASGVVISRAILRDVFGKADVTKAVSTTYLWVVLVPIAAPLIGGFIVHYLSWYFTMFFVAAVGLCTLFFYRRLFAVLPVSITPCIDKAQSIGLGSILGNRSFFLNALANMFVVSIMVLFATNYSQLAALNYHLDTHQLGYLLSLFNGSIAAGFYLARALLVRVSVRWSLSSGGVLLLVGWLAVWGAINLDFSGQLILASLVVACLGKGVVMSLCAGQALIPFAAGVGKASACYTLIQSLGSTVFAFYVTSLFSQTIDTVMAATVVCAALSFVAVVFLNVLSSNGQLKNT